MAPLVADHPILRWTKVLYKNTGQSFLLCFSRLVPQLFFSDGVYFDGFSFQALLYAQLNWGLVTDLASQNLPLFLKKSFNVLAVFFALLSSYIMIRLHAFLCKLGDKMFLLASEFIMVLPLCITWLVRISHDLPKARRLPLLKLHHVCSMSLYVLDHEKMLSSSTRLRFQHIGKWLS